MAFKKGLGFYKCGVPYAGLSVKSNLDAFLEDSRNGFWSFEKLKYACML